MQIGEQRMRQQYGRQWQYLLIVAQTAGFVISLLGFALAYAQLVPVPCKTTREAYDLREAQATDIQKQVLRYEGSAPLDLVLIIL